MKSGPETLSRSVRYGKMAFTGQIFFICPTQVDVDTLVKWIGLWLFDPDVHHYGL